MELLIPLLIAAFVTMALIPPLARRAGSMHLLDSPDERKVHDHPMPRVGGVAMAAGAAVALAAWLPWNALSLSFVSGAIIIFVFGLLDDRRGLSPWTKLAGQSVAAALVIVAGGVEISTLTLTSPVELPRFVSLPLTFLFLLGVTNAINLADGLDGLAGGTTFLCFAALAALAVAGEDPFVLIVSCVMVGAALGFLRFNSFPARVFMGDSGSQLLGFTAGVLAVVLTQDSALPYSSALPLLLLGLPILDTLTVMVRRIAEGRSPFLADNRHLHHRLLARGFDHFESVAIIYLLQGGMLLAAWLLRFSSDLLILATFSVIATGLLVALYVGKRRNWRWDETGHGFRLGRLVSERVPWLKAPAHLPRWGNAIAWACLAAYFLGVAITGTETSRDIAWLAAALAALLVLSLSRVLQPGASEYLGHFAVFVAAAIAVYLDHFEPNKSGLFTAAKWALFPVLGMAVLMRLRFWRERRFELTTLDILVVFLAVVLPNLPGLQGAPSNLGLSVAKLILLMYAIELLSRHSDRTRRWLYAVTLAAMALVAIHGFWPAIG